MRHCHQCANYGDQLDDDESLPSSAADACRGYVEALDFDDYLTPADLEGAIASSSDAGGLVLYCCHREFGNETLVEPPQLVDSGRVER